MARLPRHSNRKRSLEPSSTELPLRDASVEVEKVVHRCNRHLDQRVGWYATTLFAPDDPPGRVERRHGCDGSTRRMIKSRL
jgi:hypothetical protein